MTTNDSVIYSVVGEIVPVVEPAVVPPPTPDVLGALEDPTLLENYSTHVALLIWQQWMFICLFYVFWLFICVIPYVHTVLTLFLSFFCRSLNR